MPSAFRLAVVLALTFRAVVAPVLARTAAPGLSLGQGQGRHVLCRTRCPSHHRVNRVVAAETPSVRRPGLASRTRDRVTTARPARAGAGAGGTPRTAATANAAAAHRSSVCLRC